jgi:hypothetical protein
VTQSIKFEVVISEEDILAALPEERRSEFDPTIFCWDEFGSAFEERLQELYFLRICKEIAPEDYLNSENDPDD